MSQRIDIASIRADHIIELGSGASKKTRRLMDAHFRVAPEERVLTEISRKFTPDQLHQLLDRGGFALQSNNQTPNKYFELVLACFRKINADIAIKIHPRPRAISAFWLVKIMVIDDASRAPSGCTCGVFIAGVCSHYETNILRSRMFNTLLILIRLH